jgi:HK97 family phage portal protein
MMVGHLLLRGNFYARIDPPLLQMDRESPSLVPLNPDRMKPPRQDSLGYLAYDYTYADGKPRTFTQDELLHVKLLTTDGFVGMSPLSYARESIGLATAQSGYASSIFSGGGFIKYYLKTSKRLGAEGKKNFREGWRDLHGDPRNFEPPILEDDMDIHTLGMNNEDAQFLESR